MGADGVNYTRPMMARYRLRTSLRGKLPRWAGRLVPKGSRDCGAHEWYHAEDSLDRCYHCEVGRQVHSTALGPSVGEVLRARPWEHRGFRGRSAFGRLRDGQRSR
jgi:hypothetical protein